MVSSTPSSTRLLDCCRCLCLACLAGLWLAAPAQAAGIETVEYSLAPVEEGLELNASFRIDIPEELENLVERGVGLTFKAEVEVSRPRWYWFDQQMAKKTLELRLSYHALTRKYRVAVGNLQQTFPTLREAMQRISRLRGWLISEHNQLKPGVEYEISFAYYLDLSQLPKPLRLTAFTSSGWELSAPQIDKVYTPIAK